MKNIKVTKNLIKTLKPFYKRALVAQEKFYDEIRAIEDEIQEMTGVNAELFMCDNEIVGIGNYERTIKLIHGKELL